MDHRHAISVSIATLLASTSVYAQTAVTACGTTLTGPGILTVDLDCSSYVGDAVILAENTRLDLAGFTLKGGDGHGVRCERNCRVSSSLVGGRITGASGSGIDGFTTINRSDVAADSLLIDLNDRGIGTLGNVTITNCTIRDNARDGIALSQLFAEDKGYSAGSAKVSDSSITGNGSNGITAPRSLRITDSDVSANVGNGVETSNDGIGPGKVVSKSSTFDGNGGHGIEAAVRVSIRGGGASGNVGSGVFCGPGFNGNCSIGTRDAAFDDNGQSGLRARGNISSSRASIRGGSASRNGFSGVFADGNKRDLFAYGQVKCRGATVNDNGTAGLGTADGKVAAKGCTVTGNALEATCSPSGVSPCLDIDGPDRAIVRDTICDTPVSLCSP